MTGKFRPSWQLTAPALAVFRGHICSPELNGRRDCGCKGEGRGRFFFVYLCMPSSFQKEPLAVMFTDIQGYTNLTSKDQMLALNLIDKKRSLFRGNRNVRF